MGNVQSSTTTPLPEERQTAMYIPQMNDPLVANQTKVVEGTGDWGSGVHRSTLCSDDLVSIVDPYVTTLYDNFRHGASISWDKPCAGEREVVDGVANEYTFFTYSEIIRWASDIGSAMRYLGTKRGDTIGLYSRNCVKWTVVEQACNAFSHPTVAIYDTFGSEAVRYIIDHSEQRIVFVDKKKLTSLLQAVAAGTPKLEYAVCFGDITEVEVKSFAEHGVKLMTLVEMTELGHSHPQQHDPPKSSDTAILMYTSGTTGMPKGVVISHLNMVACVNATNKTLDFDARDVLFSFLPLAHCFGRITEAIAYYHGATVGYWQGDVRKLAEDAKVLRPTVFVGVPRVYNRLYERVMQVITSSGKVTQQLYHRAYAYRKAAMEHGQDTPWCNYLLFDKLKATLGGRIRNMISGSAPLDPKVHEWLRVCLCPVVRQGYGLTETCASTMLQPVNDTSVGTVGQPLPCNEFKLANVPDMQYFTSDNPPKGELLIRGHGVFEYYFKDPEKTKQEKDEDGWFHTGDIAQWNANGGVSIIDRKKNIFKLAQGEYIAVENIEGTYELCQHISQVFIYGDSLKTFLLAVVVPDKEETMIWAKKKGIEGNFNAVCQHADTRTMLEAEMTAQAKTAKLKGFEVVKGIIVHSEPFTVENNLMTPTFKLKRPVAVKVFKERFNCLYDEIEARLKQ